MKPTVNEEVENMRNFETGKHVIRWATGDLWALAEIMRLAGNETVAGKLEAIARNVTAGAEICVNAFNQEFEWKVQRAFESTSVILEGILVGVSVSSSQA
jgi:hypothetical protein